MASLFTKNTVYYVRFRYAGRSFKRTLETDSRTAAEYKQRQIDTFLDGLKGGHETVPNGIEPGPFIVSLGTNQIPQTSNLDMIDSMRQPTATKIVSVIKPYLRYRSRSNSPDYVKTQQYHLGKFGCYLDSESIASLTNVTKSIIEDFIFDHLEENKASTKRGYRASIIPFFKWLKDQELIASNPAKKLPTIAMDAEQLEFWSSDQIENYARKHNLDDRSIRDQWRRVYYTMEQVHEIIQTVCVRAYHPTICLLHAIPAYTGCRRGEALKLLHSDINFAEGFITFRSKKQSRTQRVTKRRVPIMPELRNLLDKYLPLINRDCEGLGSSELVLRHPDTGLQVNPDQSYRLFDNPLRGTHIEVPESPRWYKLRFHTYRHSFISNLACAATDQRFIDKWVGHTTEAMRQRYRHLFPNMQHDAISVLSAMTSD
jgi:integrase